MKFSLIMVAFGSAVIALGLFTGKRSLEALGLGFITGGIIWPLVG